MANYPKWLYAHGQEPKLVADEAAHQALGAGWVESPADAKPEAPKAEPQVAVVIPKKGKGK